MFRDVAFLYVRYPVHRIGLRRRLLPYADTYGTMTVIRGGDFLIIYQVVGMYRPSLEIHVWNIVRILQPSAVERVHALKSRIRTLSSGEATTFFLLLYSRYRPQKVLESQAERYKSSCASNTSPPRNHCIFL